MKPTLHFIIGGGRSGKSQRAETLAQQSRREIAYLATCRTEGLDAEMQERINNHRARRPAAWKTVENRFDLVNILNEESLRLVLIDTLTLWVSHWQAQGLSEEKILRDLEETIKPEKRATALIIVGDEIGLGLVPADAESRAFRDLCGRANQLVAREADSVELMVAGLPLAVKGKP